MDPDEARLIKSDDRMARVLDNLLEGLIRADLLPRDELSFGFRGTTLRLTRLELARPARRGEGGQGPIPGSAATVDGHHGWTAS